jgi:hypothetical protein
MHTTVPTRFDSTYYDKAFEWNGLHVLAPDDVDGLALLTVAETIANMLRYRPDMLQLLAQQDSRFVVTSQGGTVTDTPEFSHLIDEETFDGRPWSEVSGLAGYANGWMAINNVDNVLSLPSDAYRGEQNISLHEFAHVIHQGAIDKIPELKAQLTAAYDAALAAGLWAGTYAGATIYEYFAVGTEAFFDFERQPDSTVNFVNTRAEMASYDPALYAILVSVYGNDSWRDGDWIGDGDRDVLAGLATPDLIFGVGGDDVLVGEGGNDSLYGGDGNDQLFAGAGDNGDDRLYGENGNDTLGGGAGNDIVTGGPGSDTLFGGEGADILRAGNPNAVSSDGGSTTNVIWAGAGADSIFGDNTADTLGGGAGIDTFFTAGGADVVFGGKGDAATNGDIIRAGDGDDTVFASNGNDDVMGEGGSDILYGGDGNDTIAGGTGNDTLWGGFDNDLLLGEAGADVFGFAVGSGRDTVRGFEDGIDLIDLSGYAGAGGFPDIQAKLFAATGGVEIRLSATDIVLLEGINLAILTADDFTFLTS